MIDEILVADLDRRSPNYFDLKKGWPWFAAWMASDLGRWSQNSGLERIGTIVFRTVGDQISWWESVLPEQVLRLPQELARVDILLDDPVFSRSVQAVL